SADRVRRLDQISSDPGLEHVCGRTLIRQVLHRVLPKLHGSPVDVVLDALCFHSDEFSIRLVLDAVWVRALPANERQVIALAILLVPKADARFLCANLLVRQRPVVFVAWSLDPTCRRHPVPAASVRIKSSKSSIEVVVLRRVYSFRVQHELAFNWKARVEQVQVLLLILLEHLYISILVANRFHPVWMWFWEVRTARKILTQHRIDGAILLPLKRLADQEVCRTRS